MNVLRIFSLSFSNYTKSVSSRDFSKNQDFIRKTYLFSKKNAKLWTFWESSLFQSHSTTNLILWEVFKFWRLFLKKSVFSLGKPQFLNILKNLTILNAFYRKVHNFSNFEKFNSFFQKTSIFSEKTHFLKVLRIFNVSVACNCTFESFRTFQKFQDCIEKSVSFSEKPKSRILWGILLFRLLSTEKVLTLVFLKYFGSFFFGKYQVFWENSVFERFEKFHFFSRMQQQVCCF